MWTLRERFPFGNYDGTLQGGIGKKDPASSDDFEAFVNFWSFYEGIRYRNVEIRIVDQYLN